MIELLVDTVLDTITRWDRTPLPDSFGRKARTTSKARVRFERARVPIVLDGGSAGGLTLRTRQGSILLSSSSGWSPVIENDRTAYEVTLSTLTQPVLDELGTSPSLAAKLEVYWTEPDVDERSATADFLIRPPVTTGDESTPTPVTPPYPSASAVQAAIDALGTKQPLDSDLTAIAALSTTAYGRAFLTLANQAALVALLPAYQPLDSDLTAIAGLTTTSFGRSLLILANAAALRTAAGLASTNDVTFNELVVAGVNVTSDANVGGSLSAADAITFGSSINGVTAAELAYLSGVTSAIQDQLDNRQPLDSDLTAIAALTTTSFGRALLALADEAALRTAAGLGTADSPVFSNVRASSASPRISIDESDQGTDGKLWDIVAASGSLLFRALVDSGLSGATWLTVVRSGATVTSIAAGAPVRLKSYTVATLPTGAEGDMAFVTDATAPTYLGALTGGGTVKVPVYFHGPDWLSH